MGSLQGEGKCEGSVGEVGEVRRAECRWVPGEVLGAETEDMDLRGDRFPASWVGAHRSSNSRRHRRQMGSWIA